MRYLALLFACAFLLPITASATTYATWNPADKSTHITLTAGNLTATNDTSGTDGAVRSTISKSSGKWYWELTGLSGTNCDIVGIALGTASIAASATGFDPNSWGFYPCSAGLKFNNSASGGAYGANIVGGDVVGVALDMDGGTVTIYKNGVSQGTMYTGLSGAMFASVGNGGTNVTANFGATALSFTPPAGYCAGLVDVCPGGGGGTIPWLPLVIGNWW